MLDKESALWYSIDRKRKEIQNMTNYIQNIECGNIFPATVKGLCEAHKEAAELYDLDDPTNAVEFWEYYQIIRA